MAEINNKEKFWQERPETIRILLQHNNGGILKIFAPDYIIWEARKVRPAGSDEKMFILEKIEKDEV